MKDVIEQRLGELKPLKHRGQTRALRERYDAIEAALARGVTRQQIIELLAENGVQITLPFFKTILHRLREEKRSSQASAEVLTKQVPVPRQADDKPEHKQADAWHRIDEIANSTPDLQSLRRQHLNSLKRERQ